MQNILKQKQSKKRGSENKNKLKLEWTEKVCLQVRKGEIFAGRWSMHGYFGPTPGFNGKIFDSLVFKFRKP